MKSNDFRVAIDIGTTKICTMVGRIKDQNTYEVINITTIDNNGMNRGLVVDEQLVSECITKSLESVSKEVGINSEVMLLEVVNVA